MNLQSVLRKIPFLSDLVEEQLDRIAAIGLYTSIAANQVVYEANDPGDCLYIILTGQVRVIKVGKEGKEFELARLETGHYFGEMALIDGLPRSATIATSQPCELLLIDRDDFLKLLAETPSLLSHLMTNFTGKIRHSNEKSFHLFLEQEQKQLRTESERHQSMVHMISHITGEIDSPLTLINQTAIQIQNFIQENKPEEALQSVAHMLSTITEVKNLIASFNNR